MSTEPVATEALVLRRSDFSETSQIGVLYSRALGRVSVLAKGIKRCGPDLRGPMDLLARAEIRIRPRRAEQLALLQGYRVVTGYPGLRRRVGRLWAGFYVAEVLREGTRDFDPDPGLFDLASDTLGALSEAAEAALAPVLSHFDLRFLALSGFLPEFQRCADCGREAPPRRPVRFAPAISGLLCRRCAPRRPLPTVILDAGARDAVESCLGAESPAEAATLTLDRARAALLRSLLPRIQEQVLEKEIRSARFVLG